MARFPYVTREQLPEKQIERLANWESDPAFNEQEHAVIRYAAEATREAKEKV